MEDKRSLYAFIGVLLGFKVWTLILILWLTSSWKTVVFILAGHIVWVAVGAILISGPTAFWLRLFRVRRKRKILQHAEWHVDDSQQSFRAGNASDS